jgi:hypothetical protein
MCFGNKNVGGWFCEKAGKPPLATLSSLKKAVFREHADSTSFPHLRESSLSTHWLWIPAFARMTKAFAVSGSLPVFEYFCARPGNSTIPKKPFHSYSTRDLHFFRDDYVTAKLRLAAWK